MRDIETNSLRGQINESVFACVQVREILHYLPVVSTTIRLRRETAL